MGNRHEESDAERGDYQINQTNAVTPDLALDPTGSTSVQTGEVRSRGIELSGVGNVTRNFSVIATAKYDW
ncbi:iron complex outermembrane receptor protein [Paraburkholderia fungorum]|uniref:Iron complex outermembrane receptor protein n=1 Tax=Paraburkholderia fungorum TaxID=134537 RepID=A0AAW3UQJ2_9BURK|nr:hypothetical protein [Paraburkholderia fungorum]MBB4513459.1 iron complex outermembrane receptor protein [Paraburkholderia fungorum]MBB6200699.1 iron complex outermembrane receptor protein [Paraburkholderia fungorum]